MWHIKNYTLPFAYHDAICRLYDYGEHVYNNNFKTATQELTNVIIHVEAPTAESRISKLTLCDPEQLQKYELEILYDINAFEVGGSSTAWDHTYGTLIRNQLPGVIELLQKDKSTRQAVIALFNPTADKMNASCLVSFQFFVRRGHLDQLVYFRSNDLLNAFFFDAWTQIRLQEEVAKVLGVHVGAYTHMIGSMHAYQKDYDTMEAYHKKILDNVGSTGEITYKYEGFYDELMAESIPNILQTINARRSIKGLPAQHAIDLKGVWLS